MAATGALSVLPSSDDPFLARAVSGIGGPPGRHVRTRRRLWTPVRIVVALTLLTCTLGLVQKSPCSTHPWSGEYQYTRLCYTDVFALYYAEGLVDGQRPYLDHPVEYPVLMGAAMEVGALAVAPLPAGARPQAFLTLTWALLTGCAVVVAVTTVRLAGRRPFDGALVAVSPVLALHVVTNWDLLAVALAGAGLLAWARRRPALAGVLLGLGVAAKLYPVLFLLPLVLLGLRGRRLRPVLLTALTTLLTAAAVTLPVYLASPSYAVVAGRQVPVAASPLARWGSEGLAALAPHRSVASPSGTVEAVNGVYRFVEVNATRGADWDSLWFALQTVRGVPLAHLDAAAALVFLVLLAGIAALALAAPRPPRLAALLFVTLTAFLLANKVFSPQYSLWLLPLAVLARPRWGPILAWQAGEALVLLTRFLFFVGNDQRGQGIGVGWFLGAVGLRDLLLLLLAGLVVRDALQPERDPVRASGVDDPAAGLLGAHPAALSPASARP